MRAVETLFVGDTGHREFGEAWRWLRSRSQSLCSAASTQEAVTLLRRGPLAPHVIVMAQARPGQFRQCDVEMLHRCAPLARLIALLGSWCEGETCSGVPWTGVLRLYWHEFVARLERDAAAGSGAKAWSLPRTATDAERIEVSCRPLAPHSGLIAIAAASRADYEVLAEGCAQAGYAAAWIRPDGDGSVPKVMSGLWDDSCLSGARPLPLSRFARMLAPAPALALLHFPRTDDWRRASADGAAGVFAKPFSLDDVLSDLTRLADREPPTVPAHAA